MEQVNNVHLYKRFFYLSSVVLTQKKKKKKKKKGHFSQSLEFESLEFVLA